MRGAIKRLRCSVRLGYCATEADSWARGGASASAAAMTSLLWNVQTGSGTPAVRRVTSLLLALAQHGARLIMRATRNGSTSASLQCSSRYKNTRKAPRHAPRLAASRCSSAAGGPSAFFAVTMATNFE
uniref:Uncharacterized protein n=1 Tax=Ixodes ricinus TaxID=34613 RepID=A0A6B0UQH9_IXORI